MKTSNFKLAYSAVEPTATKAGQTSNIWSALGGLRLNIYLKFGFWNLNFAEVVHERK